MTLILLILLYIIIGILLFFAILKKNSKSNIVGTYSGFVFALLFYYVLIPLLVIMNMDVFSDEYNGIRQYVEMKSPIVYIYTLFLLLLGFLGFNMFYNLGYKKITVNPVKAHQFFYKEKSVKVFTFLAYSTLIIGGVTSIMYFNSYGGILNALSFAEINRSFATSAASEIGYASSLLFIPARLVTVSPYLFFFLSIFRNKRSYKLLFIVSFILSILFFLFNAGRAPLMVFLLSFVYVFMKIYFKRVWGKLLIIGILSMPLLDVLDRLFVFFNKKEWQEMNVDYISYLYQFTYPLKNILNVTDIVDRFGFRLGTDLITAFVNFIPGVNFSKSYENTSLYFSGYNWKVIGGTPNDIITFGYIQFSFIGVFILFCIIGYLLGVIDSSLKTFPDGHVKNLILSSLVANSFFIVANGDFESILRNNFILIILSIAVIMSTRYKTNNK